MLIVIFFKIKGFGALIRIGNSSYSSFYSDGGILVSSGFITRIAIDREFISILPKPYSNCEVDSNSPSFRSDSFLFNLIGRSDFAYTQQLCLVQCMQKHFIDKYECTYPNVISLFTNISTCNLDIVNSNTFSFENFDGNYINNICLPLCPLECNQTLYKTSISSYQFNGNVSLISMIKQNPNLASDFIRRTIDSTTTKESIVQVRIFYESLSFAFTTESPQMDLVSLLASLGGNVGLFLGASVFSLCELFEVIIEIIFMLKGRRNLLIK